MLHVLTHTRGCVILFVKCDRVHFVAYLAFFAADLKIRFRLICFTVLHWDKKYC